jgi:hypothetical protein
MTGHDPLTVACPDCTVPAGTLCTIRPGAATTWHRTRMDAARHAAAAPGTCGLCHQPLHRLDPTDAAACPPIPDPLTDPQGWAMATNLGYSTGHPGIEHWQADHRGEHYPECNPGCDSTGHRLLGKPNDADWYAEQGRRLASERDDLIAQGVDPADLTVPLHPGDPLP